MANTDATEFLNRQLALLPQLPRIATREWVQRECTGGSDHELFKQDGPDPHPPRYCRDVRHEEQYVAYAVASVVSTEIVVATEPNFGDVQPTGIPEQVRIATREYQNPTTVSITYQSSLTVSGVQSTSVRLTDSVSTTLRRGLVVRGTFAFGSADASVSLDTTVSSTDEYTEVQTATVQKTNSDTFAIPPKTSVKFEFLVYESSARIPFKLKAIIDGDLASNSAGLTRASQLLTEEQRSLDISGFIQVSGLSNGKVRISYTKIEDGLFSQPSQIWYEEKFQLDHMLTEFIRSNFVSVAQLNRTVDDNQSVLALDGPTIGPPDGVHYQIVSTRSIYQPTPACGFNDLGSMQLGEFSLETREYTEWRDGAEVRRWTDEISLFVRCIIP